MIRVLAIHPNIRVEQSPHRTDSTLYTRLSDGQVLHVSGAPDSVWCLTDDLGYPLEVGCVGHAFITCAVAWARGGEM